MNLVGCALDQLVLLQLLSQERAEDADWALLVDRLDLALRDRG